MEAVASRCDAAARTKITDLFSRLTCSRRSQNMVSERCSCWPNWSGSIDVLSRARGTGLVCPSGGEAWKSMLRSPADTLRNYEPGRSDVGDNGMNSWRRSIDTACPFGGSTRKDNPIISDDMPTSNRGLSQHQRLRPSYPNCGPSQTRCEGRPGRW